MIHDACSTLSKMPCRSLSLFAVAAARFHATGFIFAAYVPVRVMLPDDGSVPDASAASVTEPSVSESTVHTSSVVSGCVYWHE